MSWQYPTTHHVIIDEFHKYGMIEMKKRRLKFDINLFILTNVLPFEMNNILVRLKKMLKHMFEISDYTQITYKAYESEGNTSPIHSYRHVKDKISSTWPHPIILLPSVYCFNNCKMKKTKLGTWTYFNLVNIPYKCKKYEELVNGSQLAKMKKYS